MITALVLLPVLPLLLSTANLLVWRPVDQQRPAPRAAALVPARNEAATIEACVRSLLAEPFEEVIVCDDNSTDGTADVLARITDPRLRVIRGRELPAGWVGKPHACHQLAEAARSDVLVFVDADVRLFPGALSRIAGAMQGEVLSLLPRQLTGSIGEALVLPLLHLTYTGFLLLPLVGAVRDARVLACNGQVLAVSRSAYDRIGGFAAVRADVVDDMAFCRRAKELGLRVDFRDGATAAECRMYRSGSDAVAGFSKNLYEGVGSAPGLLAVVAVYWLCFLLPWLMLPISPLYAGIGVAINLVHRVLLAIRFRHAPIAVLLHPVSIVLFAVIAARSWWWSRSNAIRWRDRTYAAKSARLAP